MPPPTPTIVGILNLTADSFSDGGRYLAPSAAIQHAEKLHNDGAAIIDIGAESTHPASADVPPGEQIDRLLPIARELRARNIPISLDATHPEVIRALAPLGLAHLNSVTALRDNQSIAIARELDCKIVLMFSRNAAADTGRAADAMPIPGGTDKGPGGTDKGPGGTDKGPGGMGKRYSAYPCSSPSDEPAPGGRDTGLGGTDKQYSACPCSALLDEIKSFFSDRIADLTARGIARDRLILDPGMGFFLGPGVEPSLTVLRHLRDLHDFDLPLYLCTSRKSFLGELLADEQTKQPRPIADRAAATLATELWAAQQGVQFIRTHDPRQLTDALRTMHALRTMPDLRAMPGPPP